MMENSDSSKIALYDAKSIQVLKKLHIGRFCEIDKVSHKCTPEIIFARKVYNLPKLFKISQLKFEEFEKNLKILTLNNHKNIIQIFSTYVDEKKEIYTVFMTYYEKGSINDLMEATKQPIPVDRIKKWLTKLMSALHFLHERCYAHR